MQEHIILFQEQILLAHIHPPNDFIHTETGLLFIWIHAVQHIMNSQKARDLCAHDLPKE